MQCKVWEQAQVFCRLPNFLLQIKIKTLGVQDQKNHVIVMDIMSLCDRLLDGIAVVRDHPLLLVLGVLVILHLRDVVMIQAMVTTIEAETHPEAVEMITANEAHPLDVAVAPLHLETTLKAGEEKNG